MVTEISSTRLKAGYENKPYFWTPDPEPAVIFRAPVTGVTTENSPNPRSELRQMLPNGEPAAWSNKNETWSMDAEFAVTHLPDSSDNTRGVVAMQVHDGNDDVTVVRFERTGKVWITKGDTTHHDEIIASYTLGTRIRVGIEARKGDAFRWFLNGVHVATPVGGVREGCFFKAGCYTQGNESNSTGYGETKFWKLRVWRS